MNGRAHPALAACHAGGGTPGRIMAAAIAANAWIAGVLEAQRPRFLDEDMLAPLLALPSPDDVLEDVLARLGPDDWPAPTIERVSAHRIRDGIAATPVEIAAHARTAAAPPVRSERRAEAVSTQPVRALRAKPSIVAKNSSATPLQTPAPAPEGRSKWIVDAARAAAETPIRVESLPPESRPVSASAPAITAGASPRTHSPPNQGKRRAIQAHRSEQADEGPIAFPIAPASQTGRATNTEVQAATATRSKGVASSHIPVEGTPKLASATPMIGGRLGGFSRLAALGRDVSPEIGAPLTDSDAGQAGSPQLGETAVQPVAPLVDARALLHEFTEALRLEMLAAGIDPLRGRR